MGLNIVFAGTPQLAAHILAQLISAHLIPIAVYTQPDRPAGRGQKMQPSPVKICAKQHQIPIYQPESLHDPNVQAQLAKLKPDVMIVVGYGMIVPEAVLAIPTYACINVHVSLLPKWRGAAPIQRAIQAGDTETGVTIMQMDAGLDTGPMLLQLTCPISLTDTSVTLEHKLQPLGAKGLLKVISNLDYYLTHAKPQNNDDVTYAKKITKAEAQVDWQLPATQLQCSIRAFNAIPGMYTWLDGERIKIFQSEVIDFETNTQPGTIVKSDAETLIVNTGNKQLAILECQFAGSKRLAIADMMHAKRDAFTVGKQFGNNT